MSESGGVWIKLDYGLIDDAWLDEGVATQEDALRFWPRNVTMLSIVVAP
ncbi:hypothetical protein [Azospirillum doebereinerae]